jgi:glycosyltransferase involved in cell wall biosynthesis
MRILIFTPYFPPNVGGLETLVGELAGDLVGRGHTVQVMTSSEPGDLPPIDRWRGAAVRRLPLHTALARNDVRRIAGVRAELAGIKRDFDADVIHIHLADAAVIYHALTETESPAPCVLTVHSALAAAEAREGTVLRRALEHAEVVTACSQSMLDQLLAVVPTVGPRARVVLNGIDIARIEPSPLPDGPPRVLLVGRLVDEKGFDVGLRACARLVGAHPDLEVLLVGDGIERGPLLALAEELGIADRVDAPGAVDVADVGAVYARASVVAVPSRYPEPFGLVAVEAGLAARPVVASAVGGLPEVVDDGATGLLVAPDDPVALADALAAVVRNRAFAQRLADAGRRRALDRFAMDRHTTEIERLYRECAKDR